MSFVSFVALVIVIGYALLNRAENTSESKSQNVPEVMSQSDELIPQSTPPNIFNLSPTPRASMGNSQVNIRIDTSDISKQTIKLVYPSATKISSQDGQESYKTSSDGDTVYNWYKTELENRSFKIRNNVRT
ncbi:hypothetical protein HY408_01225, partial [Candidatus Gottesmanbacteria bacterium]|nr:hypothetical protein [Candidatus Gottesmanbacteria bacterium]